MNVDSEDHFKGAEEFLKEADYLLRGGFYSGVIGRSYYAMFHAATAALLALGIERSSHGGVIAAFGQYLTKPEKLPTRLHAHFREAFNMRIQCDYLPPPHNTKEAARTSVERALEFVDSCREFCEKDQE